MARFFVAVFAKYLGNPSQPLRVPAVEPHTRRSFRVHALVLAKTAIF